MKLSGKIILMACLAATIVGCGRRNGGLKTGGAAQDFRLDTLAHDRFYLNRHKGKVVVLVFWSTWCRYCKSLMVDLQSLPETADNKDFVIAAVCTDPEDINEVTGIVRDIGIKYPVLLDRGGEVAHKYKVSGLPTTVVIDREGNISQVRRGYSPSVSKQIRSKVVSLIERGKRI